MSGDVELNPGPIMAGTQQIGALSLIHLNMRSIRNKFDFITDNFLDFDILCFTESHLDDTVDSESVSIESFSVYRKDRSAHSGGILTYVSKEIYSVRRLDLESDSVHFVWIEIKSPVSSFLLCNIYRSPNTDVSFWNDLNINIENASDINPNIVIIGDLN